MTQNHLFFETPGPQPLQVVLPQTQGTKAQYDKTKGTKKVSKRKMYDESLGNIFFFLTESQMNGIGLQMKLKWALRGPCNFHFTIYRTPSVFPFQVFMKLVLVGNSGKESR